MQWFKLMGNYKPFWNNLSENIPAKHIEDIVKELNKKYNTTWEPIKNKVELKDLNNCALYTDFKSMPNYLKMLNDDGTAFYFYLVDYTQIMGNKNGLNFLAVYELDRYMTIYYGKLQTLLNNRVNVLHLFKYCDRYIYNKEKNTININLLKMPQFNNSLNVFNFNYIRKPLIAFDSEDIYNNNFSYPIPESIKLYSWNPTVRDTWNCWIKTDFLNKINKNKRYRYLVAKASALIDNLNYDITWKDAQNTPTFSSDAKIIIPIPDKMTLKMGEEPKVTDYMDITNKTLLNAFNAFDIKQTNDLTVSPLGNNFIGSYECDIPYSVWYGLSLREPDKVAFKFGYNKGVPTDEKTNNATNGRLDNVPIVFFIIDTNYAPRINLISYINNDNNTLTNKISNLIQNIKTWTPETELTLLTPLYYKEVYKQDNDAALETNLSYLDLFIDEYYNGFNTYAYLCFDSTLNIAYDYDKNNNDLNSYWNNSNSNLRNDINLSLGVYSSSAANYYNENSTAIITGIKNNQIEANKINAEAGRSATNIFTSLISGIGSFFTGNFAGGFNTIAGGMVNNGINIYKQRKQLEQNNLNLASNIKNIQTGSSATLINPYIAGMIPNKAIDNKTLFNTYSNELTDHNKAKVFNYILNNGYPFNTIAPINDYDNRQYMNILHVDTSTAGDEILNLLLDKEANLFNNLTYNNAFLGWLNQKHKVYKTTHLINVTDFMAPDYIHNIENNVDKIKIIKDINDIIKNKPDEKLLFNFNLEIVKYINYWKDHTELGAKAIVQNDKIIEIIKKELLKLNPNVTKSFLDNCLFWINLNETNEYFNVSIKSKNIKIYNKVIFILKHNNWHIITKDISLQELLDDTKQYAIGIIYKTLVGRTLWPIDIASNEALIKHICRGYPHLYKYAKFLLINFNGIYPDDVAFTISLNNKNLFTLGNYTVMTRPALEIDNISKEYNYLIKFIYSPSGLTYQAFQWRTQQELEQVEQTEFKNIYSICYIINKKANSPYHFINNYLLIDGHYFEYQKGTGIKPYKKPLHYDLNIRVTLPFPYSGVYWDYYALYTFYLSIWFNNFKQYDKRENPDKKIDMVLRHYKKTQDKLPDWFNDIPYDEETTAKLLKIQSEYDKQDKTNLKKLQEK